MPRLGVLGWPVAHSRSPAMHEAAFAAAGLTGWTYQKLPVPPELFDETVRALPGAGFTGANVTIPHKEAALALADEATGPAREIGAANTLTFADGAIHADNTDAPGLIAALPLAPAGRTALVLGGGGSARAAVWALTRAGAAEVRVWNRTPERASRLARELGARAVRTAEPADILVHCTAAGLDTTDAQLKHLPLHADHLSGYACVVDLVYRSGGTELVAQARRRNLLVVDGLDVLVHQGALSFERWTGRPASLELMQAAARASE
jgi:shikimate dehydrogenase